MKLNTTNCRNEPIKITQHYSKSTKCDYQESDFIFFTKILLNSLVNKTYQWAIITMLFLLSTHPTAFSQDLFSTPATPEIPSAPVLGNLEGRSTQSLNGTWNALIDPSVFSMNDLFHYLERNARPEPSELMEASIENGLSLQVPGDWNSQDDRLFFYTGKVWYKRDFYVKKEANKRYFLDFGGVNYKAYIYVNGTQVASHTGGYTSFNCEVTEQLKDGENLLVVKVNNTLTNSDIPTIRTDWMNYGGITRDVNLVTMPTAFIQNYKLQLAPDSQTEIAGWATVTGQSTGELTVRIPELNIQQNFAIEDGHAEIRLTPKNLQLWSLEQPKSYQVIFSTEQDEVEDKIGFRSISVKDGQIVLNGAPIFLRGISMHEEAIGAEGRAHSYQHALESFARVKELGANFVRLAHYTHNRHTLRAADELGLLIWSEIPVYWNLEFANPDVLEMAKQRMREMIYRDQNRASIIFWSLGNETPISEERTQFFRNLNTYVKSLDETRLTTAALVFAGDEIQQLAEKYFFPTLQGKTFDTWDIPIEDPLAEIVDVAAINQYFGWYYAGFLAKPTNMSLPLARKTILDNMHKVRFQLPDSKPFVFSELGAGAKRGMRAETEGYTVFSEDYQALVYERQIDMIKNQTGLVGISPWVLKDFRSVLRQRQGLQDYWNLKGLIDDNGNPKKAFFVLQDFYRSKQ